jgi:hypothetical protein
MASIRPAAAHAPRLTVWVAARTARLGARAPASVDTMLASSAPVRIRRRPRRSAIAPSAMASSPPRRTAAKALPCAPVPAPNSSAANVIVWVSSVPR